MHYTWRMDVAERHLKEAVTLAPTYRHAHHWHSHLLLARGDVAGSLESNRAALACDPVDSVLNVHLAGIAGWRVSRRRGKRSVSGRRSCTRRIAGRHFLRGFVRFRWGGIRRRWCRYGMR